MITQDRFLQVFQLSAEIRIHVFHKWAGTPDFDTCTICAKAYLLNSNSDISSKVGSLIVGLSLPLPPYFMYVRSEGSGETVYLCRLI